MRIRATALAIAAIAFAVYAWFAPQDPGNAQVITRLALALSIIERGQVDIDPWADWTIDKAEWGGHFYADKAPGHSLLAVPALAAGRAILDTLGLGGEGTDREVFARYARIGTVLVNGLASALASAGLFSIALRLGAARAGALFGSFALALGTPFFGWSTAFFAHSLSASLLVLLFGLVLAATKRAGPPFRLGLAAGLVAGLAIIVDLTSAPVVALAGLLFGVGALRGGGPVMVPMLLGFAAGGLAGLLPLPIYNVLAFGSPFKLGYSSVVGFEGMQQGFFGVTFPNAAVLWELLFGTFRGLVPLSPVLLLVPFGLARMLRKRETRIAAGVVLAASLAFLWINSSYHYWSGGYSTGPRHLVPALPFLCLALAFASPRSTVLKVTAAALLVLSFGLSAASAAVGMFAPEHLRNVFLDFLIPGLAEPGLVLRALPVVLAWGVAGAMILRAEIKPAGIVQTVAAAPA